MAPKIRTTHVLSYSIMLIVSQSTNARDLEIGIQAYIGRYNRIRPHQSLPGNTPEEIYGEKVAI